VELLQVSTSAEPVPAPVPEPIRVAAPHGHRWEQSIRLTRKAFSTQSIGYTKPRPAFRRGWLLGVRRTPENTVHSLSGILLRHRGHAANVARLAFQWQTAHLIHCKRERKRGT
jgi:hypothetical protein